MIEDGTVNIIGRVDPDKAGFRCYAHIAVSSDQPPLKKSGQKDRQPAGSQFLAMTSGDYDLEVDVMCR